MDPLTALSTASSILQFLDFGIRVVSKGNKIYRSIDGSLTDNLDLELITNDLLLLQTRLHRSSQASGHGKSPVEDVRAMDFLSSACTEDAERLLKRLNTAKAQGRFRRWKSLRQALKSLWSKSEVDEMARALQGFRTELELRVLVSLKERCDLKAIEDSQRMASLDRTALHILQALKENKSIYGDSIITQTDMLSKQIGDLDTLMRQTGSEIKKTVDIVGDDIQRLQPASRMGEEDQNVAFGERQFFAIRAIIASLAFPGMHDRYETVVEAHARTFSWIFEMNEKTADQPWDNFTSWLERGDHTYWISGKAASGKSTLMRYIFDHGATRSHLNAWAGTCQLIISTFYFWSLGTPVQKSQVGLFRSLLYQVFKANSWLVSEVLPQLVHDTASLRFKILESLEHRRSWRNWTLKELEQVFWTLINRDELATRYCFFIDGLDEFDGNFLELASFLHAVSSRPNAKICVSSRPLQEFEHQFRDIPKLRVQDLTVGDITLYIHDKLSDHPRYRVLTSEEWRGSRSLIDEIVSMSSGVFLWVSLVVKSLLKGLTNQDTLSDLRIRLHELPCELDGLYNLMLASIHPPFYLEQASRLLQLVYQSEQPATAFYLSFADDEDARYVYEKHFDSVSEEELLRRAEAMIPKLRSRCAGLLEVPTPTRRSQEWKANYYVRYLHLTVKEYLEKPEVWSKLLALTQSSGFDANLSLLRASILMLKSQIVISPRPRWDQRLWTELEETMALAARAEYSSGRPQTELLRALDHIASELRLCDEKIAAHQSCAQHWASYLHTQEQKCARCPSTFLEFAINCGLTLYVQAELSAGCQNSQKRRSTLSLLDYATWHKPWHIKVLSVEPAMVAMLLKTGSHPNANYGASTPWTNLLKYIAREAKVSERMHFELDSEEPYTKFDWPWLDVCKLFVMSGADIYAGRWIKKHKRFVSAWEILATAFEHLPHAPVSQLQGMFEERGVKTSEGPRSHMNRSRRPGTKFTASEPRCYELPSPLPRNACMSHDSRAACHDNPSQRKSEHHRKRIGSLNEDTFNAFQCHRNYDERRWKQQADPLWQHPKAYMYHESYRKDTHLQSSREVERPDDYHRHHDVRHDPRTSRSAQKQYTRSDDYDRRPPSPLCWAGRRYRWHPY